MRLPHTTNRGEAILQTASGVGAVSTHHGDLVLAPGRSSERVRHDELGQSVDRLCHRIGRWVGVGPELSEGTVRVGAEEDGVNGLEPPHLLGIGPALVTEVGSLEEAEVAVGCGGVAVRRHDLLDGEDAHQLDASRVVDGGCCSLMT